MRSSICLALLLAGCSSTPPTTPTTTTSQAKSQPPASRPAWSPEMQTIVAANNAFAFDLYAQLRAEPGNLFFSPFSIHTALAMTADGARNETLDEMVKVLHLPKDAKARLAAGDVSRFYAAGGDGYELAVANNLWGQQGFPWKADFLERQRKHYGAELTQLDFVDDANREASRKTINASIEKATRDKIKELLKKDDLTGATRLVLTNAIYFKAQWMRVFEKKNTKEEDFVLADGSKKKLPMMHQVARFRYAKSGSTHVLELPYDFESEEDVLGPSMIVLLPKDHGGLPAMEKELSAEKITEWIKGLRTHEVTLSMPKFKTESRFQLADQLKKMRMPLAFSETKADFSGMVAKEPADLFIYKVIHQSFIEVDEFGTEAAASTAVVVNQRSGPPPPATFRADHPFVYLIRDTKTGNILFLGRYTGP